MNRLRSCLAALVVASLPALASAQFWHDPSGKPIPETEAVKSRDGLGAALLITPDKDWQAKWQTAPDTTPRFNQTREVGPGGVLFILTLVSNLKVDPVSGMTDITCDLEVVRPDGTDSVRERDLPCLRIQPGDPGNVYLSNASIKYTADPGDPRGKWQVTVTVKDQVRKVSIPLHSSFVVH